MRGRRTVSGSWRACSEADEQDPERSWFDIRRRIYHGIAEALVGQPRRRRGLRTEEEANRLGLCRRCGGQGDGKGYRERSKSHDPTSNVVAARGGGV